MTVHLLPQFPLPLYSPSSFLCLVFPIVYCYGFVCFGKKSFTPDALSATTLPIYLGLGPASGNTGRCPRWLVIKREMNQLSLNKKKL